MSKLKRGELLDEVKNWYEWSYPHGDYSSNALQAYQQIVQIVNLHFSDDWQQAKKGLGKFMQEQKPRVDGETTKGEVKELRNYVMEHHTIGIKRRIKIANFMDGLTRKPEVTEEFVEKWQVGYHKDGGCLYVMPKKYLLKLLKEAGVHVS